MAFVRKSKGGVNVYFSSKTDFILFNIWNKYIYLQEWLSAWLLTVEVMLEKEGPKFL